MSDKQTAAMDPSHVPWHNTQQVAPQQPVASQQPLIIQIPTTRLPKNRDDYRSKLSIILGIIQIVGAALAVFLGAIGIWIHDSHNYPGYRDYYRPPPVTYMYYMGSAFWCSIFFCLSGAFAICSGKRRTTPLIVTHMVLAILASCCACIMLTMACAAAAMDGIRIRQRYMPSDQDYGHKLENGSMATSILWVLVSLVEFVACIWSSTLCCRVTCCAKSRDHQTSTQTIQYHPGQPVVLDSRGIPIHGVQIQSGFIPVPQVDMTPVANTDHQVQMTYRPPDESQQGYVPPPYERL